MSRINLSRSVLITDSPDNRVWLSAILLPKLMKSIVGTGEDALLYLNGGADDLLTLKANIEAYRKIQIRTRRLVDVRTFSTQL
jgi:hypothetical protein